MRYEEELQTKYDSRQSFYGKAKIEIFENDNVLTKQLLSYGTLVANYVYYKKEKKEVFEHFGTYSQTTSRHQKEFFKQLGLSDGEIKKLIGDRLEKMESEK